MNFSTTCNRCGTVLSLVGSTQKLVCSKKHWWPKKKKADGTIDASERELNYQDEQGEKC